MGGINRKYTSFKRIIFLLSVVFIFYNTYAGTITKDLIQISLFNDTIEGTYICALSPDIIIFDEKGYPLFYRKIEGGVRNFTFHKNGYYTYYSIDAAGFIKLDSLFNITDTITTVGDNYTDFHDIKFKENKVYLIGNEYSIVDMSEIISGGSQNATVSNAIIQEQDDQGNVLFNWNSINHLEIADAYENYVDFNASVIDYAHPNSIDFDSIGNIYLSLRHFNQIIKINKSTGDILWRLGGKKNDFTLVNDDYFFSGQHAIHFESDSLLYLFDNGNTFHPDYSRACIYQINQESKNLNLLKEIRLSEDIYTPLMGNVQKETGGNIIVGWGKNSENILFTEHSGDGQLLLKAFPKDAAFTYSINKLKWINPFLRSNINVIEFDTVNYTDTKTETIFIENLTLKPIELSSYYSGDTCFSLLDDFPIRIEPNAKISLSVKFSPSDKGGEFKSKLYLNSYSDSIYEQQIALSIKVQGFSPDITPPELKIYPEDQSEDIFLDTIITICSNEALRLIDDSNISENDIYDIITFKKGGLNGESILYNASINQNQDTIIIEPLSLEENTIYCLIIAELLEDYSDNIISSTESCFTTQINTGSEKHLKHHVQIYPNPCGNSININAFDHIVSIELYNILGQKVYTKTQFDKNFGHHRIDLGNCSDGIYIIKVLFTDFTSAEFKVLKK